MNARQKAKHFKKAYENLLKGPAPVRIEHLPLKRYRVAYRATDEFLLAMPDDKIARECIINNFAKQLKPFIDEHMVVEKDIYTRIQVWYLDIYAK